MQSKGSLARLVTHIPGIKTTVSHGASGCLKVAGWVSYKKRCGEQLKVRLRGQRQLHSQVCITQKRSEETEQVKKEVTANHIIVFILTERLSSCGHMHGTTSQANPVQP